MNTLQIESLCVGNVQTNCYFVKNPATRELIIVDAGDEADRIIRAVGDWKPAAVLATHGHYDHVGAADALCAHFSIPFYVHAEDIPKLKNPMGNASLMFGLHPISLQTEPIPLTDGQTLTFAGFSLTVLHTPGHSRGSCCFLLPGDQAVLCGDTLFAQGYGRTDIGDGDFKQIKQSLRRLLFEIPRQPAYPGHGESTMAGRKEGEDA